MQPAAAPPPILFCHREPDALEERVEYEKIHELLERGVRSKSGDRNLQIFTAHRDVRAGQPRRQTLFDAVDAAKVLIVVVEPLLLRDEEACELMTRFLRPARGDRRLVPIYWMKCPELDDEQRRKNDGWGQKLWQLKPVDWRMLRLQNFDSKEFRGAVAAVSEEIDAALATSVPTSAASAGPAASEPEVARGVSDIVAVAVAIRDHASRLVDLAGDSPPLPVGAAAAVPAAANAGADPAQTEMRARESVKALWQFLLHRFSADELRELLFRSPDTRGLCTELPEPSSHAALCSRVVGLLETRRLDVAFFGRLVSERPFFADQIAAIARDWDQVAAIFVPVREEQGEQSPHEVLLDLLVEVFADDTHRRSNWTSRGGELIAGLRRRNSSLRKYSLHAVQELAARELVTLDLFDDLWVRLPHLWRQIRRLEERWPIPERRRATVALLLELFTSEFDLVTFIRLDPFGLQLSASLPGPSGLRMQARRFVELLEVFEPGMLTLFRRLLIHFPERRVAIVAVAALWGATGIGREAGPVLWRDELVQMILKTRDPSVLWRQLLRDSNESLFVPEEASDFASSCALIEEIEALGTTYGEVWRWLHSQSPDAAAQIGGLDRISVTLQWVRQPSVEDTDVVDTEHLLPFEEALARVLAVLYRSRGELRWELGELGMWGEEFESELPGEGAAFLRVTRAVVAGLSRFKLLDSRLLGYLCMRFRGRQALVSAVDEQWVGPRPVKVEGVVDRTLQLARLLASLFSHGKLRILLSSLESDLGGLVSVLPEPPVRMREFALAAARELEVRGLVGVALALVASECPRRIDDVRSVAAYWEIQLAPA